MQLVVSDAHTGLKQAIAAVLAGACWQRCRVHFFRNTLARVLKTSAEMVAVTIRTIFAQLTPAEVADQVDKVATILKPRFPAVAALLVEAKEDLTAFRYFPVAHWRKLWSTNPLERLNKELKRRTNMQAWRRQVIWENCRRGVRQPRGLDRSYSGGLGSPSWTGQPCYAASRWSWRAARTAPSRRRGSPR